MSILTTGAAGTGKSFSLVKLSLRFGRADEKNEVEGNVMFNAEIFGSLKLNRSRTESLMSGRRCFFFATLGIIREGLF